MIIRAGSVLRGMRGAVVASAAQHVGLFFGQHGLNNFHRLCLRGAVDHSYSAAVQFFCGTVAAAYKLFTGKQFKNTVTYKSKGGCAV